VWAAVEHAVREALSEAARASAPAADTSRLAPGLPGYDAARVAEATQTYLAGAAPRTWAPSPVTGTTAEASSGAGTAGVAVLGADAAPVFVLGQHRNTYILATDGEDLVLVDQHTAHERVRFEALLDRASQRAAESQRLLLPLVITLPPALRAVLESQSEALEALGFDLEAFGGATVNVRAVPAILEGRDPAPALEAILREGIETEATAAGSVRDRLAASLACHSAVRAGQPLTVPAMTAIVRDLARTRHPTLCPHGRPTTVRIPKDEVSRWFGRTGWRRS